VVRPVGRIHQSLQGARDQGPGVLLGLLQADRRGIGCLAPGNVNTRFLPQQRRVALDVEDVIHNLEGKADGAAVSNEAFDLIAGAAAARAPACVDAAMSAAVFLPCM